MVMKVKMEGLPPYVEPAPTPTRVKPEYDPFDHNDEYQSLVSAMGITVPEKKVIEPKLAGVIGTVMPRRHYINLSKGATVVFPPESVMRMKSGDGVEKLLIFKRVPDVEDLKAAAGVAKELFPESTKIKVLVGRHKIDNSTVGSVKGLENTEMYTCTTAVIVVCPKDKIPYNEIQDRKAVMVSTLRALHTLVSSHLDLDLRVVDDSADLDTRRILGVGF
jgi:hypothetical protein